MGFKLTIETGNAGVSTPDDVAYLVRKVSDRMLDNCEEEGAVVDHNGNTVGYFSYTD